jgi:flavin-dependent dehydrogenase
MADVVIAGGGLAGSALAIGLAHRGVSVEVFERARFPREKPCGEGLMPAGVAALERLGVAAVPESAEFIGVRYRSGDRVAEGRFPDVAGLPSRGRALRRRDLDHALARHAAAMPGVAFHTGARVDGPIVEGGRVTGVRVDGEPHRAKLVVAADGARSRLRHALGLDRPAERRRVGMRAHFRLAAGQPATPWVEVLLGREHELYVTPLPRGELLVAALAEAGALDARVERQYLGWIQGHRALAGRLEGAEQVSELHATAPLSGRARRRVLPGCVLLGDAAGFTDPITGGGMTQALVTAELLADHAARAFSTGEGWLTVFDREREAWLRDYRRLTAMVLWLSAHPSCIDPSLAILRRVPALFTHLLGVSAGMRRLWGGEVRANPVLQGKPSGALAPGLAERRG